MVYKIETLNPIDYLVGMLNLGHIMNRACRKKKIPITTFMIAQDSYLQQFIEDFTEANGGKALFTGLDALGDSILSDYERNRKKRI